jgi:hypothetical protein
VTHHSGSASEHDSVEDDTTKPTEVDPASGTDEDGTPVENPSG